MTPTHDRITDRLSEWLDGGLVPAEHAEVEAHLAGCGDCAAIAEELRAVRTEAARLGPIAPAADLWPGILARIQEESARAVDTGEIEPARATADGARRGRVVRMTRRQPPVWSFTLPRLALAASLLVVLSGGMVWLMLTNGGGRESAVARRQEPGRQEGPAVSGTPAMAAGFDVARYEATISELEQVLVTHRSELDTSTVRVIEQNLATIDRAVEEARRALAADPASRYLNTHLASQLRQKAQLLRQATSLVVPS